MGKLWAFFNGNKTKIGAAVLLVGKLIGLFNPEIGQIVEVIGTVATSGGLAHATVKVVTGQPQTPVEDPSQDHKVLGL